MAIVGDTEKVSASETVAVHSGMSSSVRPTP